MSCYKFDSCLFFQKYKDALDSADYSLIVESYCKGALMSRCERLVYEKINGEKPPVNMSPTGVFMHL
jgi:hypothetical protein